MKDDVIVVNWIGYKRLDDGGCAVKSYADGGTVTILNRDEYALLKRMRDGQVEMDEIAGNAWMEDALMKFADGNILRLRRSPAGDGRTDCHTLFCFKRTRRTGAERVFFWLFSMLTLLLSPVSLLYVVHFFRVNNVGLGAVADCLTLSGMVGTALAGICLHEFGHVASAWGHGARVFEFGFMTYRKILFSGAYVLNDSDYECGRLGRIQTSLAGVEVNLVLAALFLLVADRFPVLGEIGICGAATNLGLAGWNLFARDTDGMAVMEDVLQDAHVNGSIKGALLFFLPRKGKGIKERRFSGLHFAACVSLGLIRLIPVIYWAAVLSSLLHLRWDLGWAVTWLLDYSAFFAVGTFAWLIWNYVRKAASYVSWCRREKSGGKHGRE